MDGVTYANPPGAERGISWLNRLTPIERRETMAGDMVTLHNWYCDEHVVHRES